MEDTAAQRARNLLKACHADTESKVLVRADVVETEAREFGAQRATFLVDTMRKTILLLFSLAVSAMALQAAVTPVLTMSQLLGGNTWGSTATGVAVDSAGNTYVAGYTNDSNFPFVTQLQKACSIPASQGECGQILFVAKFDVNGTLVYLTHFGGTGQDQPYAIAVDSTGAAYVTGSTTSIDFPTVNAYQTVNPVCPPACGTEGPTLKFSQLSTPFVAKLNPAGNALVYSTYLGGLTAIPYPDAGLGIAVDAAGNAYIAGKTGASNFPLVNPIVSTFKFGQHGFVAELSASGSQLLFSTYLGGSSNDTANAIAVDSSGNMYVTGATFSKDFPVMNAVQPSNQGVQDVFVTKISATAKLVYSTYLGGFNNDIGNAIAVDATGAAYITGSTSSPPTTLPNNQGGFPLVNALQSKLGGATDAFAAKLDPTGSTLVYSTYLGGSSTESGTGIAVDTSGNAYIAGSTGSNDFPAVNALQNLLGGPAGTTNAFLTILNPTGSAMIESTFLGGQGQGAAAAIAVDRNGTVSLAGSAGTNFPTLPPTPLAGTSMFGNAFVARIAFPATAPACQYALPSSNVTVNASAGFANVVIVANSSACTWQVSLGVPWITVASALNGSGIGDIMLVIAANPGLTSRTGTISVAGLTVNVTQNEPDQFTVSAASGVAGGLARVPVTMTVDPSDFPNSGYEIGSISTTLTVSQSSCTGLPAGCPPAITAPLAFLADPAMPTPQVTSSAGSITLTWPPYLRPLLLTGTTKLGELLVTIPIGANTGQTYIAHSNGGTILVDKTYTIGGGPDGVISVGNPAPAITWLTPSSAAPGSAALTVNVYGQGFVATSVVTWNGTARPTTFVSETQLQASITTADLASAGTAQVAVSNPAPNGGVSAKLPFAITTATAPSILAGGIVDAADYKITESGDTIVSIFGANLAASTASATSLPLSTTLGGATVLVDGVPAPLFYVSSTQINVQLPWRLLNQTQTTIAVMVNGLTSNAIVVPLAVRPVIFTLNSQGTGQGAILDGVAPIYMAPAGSVPGSTARPATAGEIVSIYCTGLGAVHDQDSLVDGYSTANSTPFNGQLLTTPTVTIGGANATVQYAGLAPSYVGLYQVNVVVPSGVSGSALNVVMTIGAATSNTVTMAVQ